MQGIQINNINAIAICANSNRLAIEDHDYSITIWSIEKKSKESILQNSSQKNTKIWSMVFSGNGKLLFSCHIDEKIRVWDVSDKFVLIQVQDVWPHIDNLYDSRYLLSLQMFPVKDEEYIYIYLQNQEVYNFLSDSIICHFGQTIVLEYLFDDQTKLRNYSVGFSEANNLIAIQFKTKLNLYDISSKQAQLIATLEGNSFEKQSLSSILVFSQKGNNLLSLGRNQTLRLWEISDKTQIKLSINLTKAVQALAFQFLDPETIRIISKSGEIIDQNISDYQEIGIIEDQKNFDFTTAKQSLKEQRYIGKFEKRNLQIFDTQIDELKYTLSDLSSKIMHLQFTPSGEQFILGMEDGSIQLYQIDKQSLQSYGKPVCYYQFAKSTLIQAFYCKISQSVFLTKENENFEKLFSEEIK